MQNAEDELIQLAATDFLDLLLNEKGYGRRHLIGGSVCHRELGVTLSKDPQWSDWQRRPLTASQLEYAALDAEVLMAIHVNFVASLPLGLPMGE